MYVHAKCLSLTVYVHASSTRSLNVLPCTTAHLQRRARNSRAYDYVCVGHNWSEVKRAALSYYQRVQEKFPYQLKIAHPLPLSSISTFKAINELYVAVLPRFKNGLE